MSKTKQLFMEIREKEGDQHMLENSSVFNSNILCPNCMKRNLLEYSHIDLYCEGCGQEFVKVGKAVRFK